MLHNQYVVDMNDKFNTIPTEIASNLSNCNLSIAIDKQQNDTISILTNYGLPKTSEYYTSKDRACILDKYHPEIIQSFKTNDMQIHQLYDSSINSSQFVSNIMQSIEVDQLSTAGLQSAIKKLYTILQLHQHYIIKDTTMSAMSPLTATAKTHCNTICNAKSSPKIATKPVTSSGLQKSNYKKRRLDNMIRELSRSKSQVFSLQEQNDILQSIADENHRKLMQTEHKKHEYKRNMNALKLTHNQISHKMIELEEENQELKQKVSEYEYLATQTQNVRSLSLSNVMHYDILGVQSVESDSDSYSMDINREREGEECKLNELKILNDADIAKLSEFYRKMERKQTTTKPPNIQSGAKKKSFWDTFWSGFECIPSFD